MFRLALVFFAAMYLSDACIEYDTVKQLGSHWKNLKVSSADECQRACQAEKPCKYWVWNGPESKKNDGMCFLKKSAKGKPSKVKGKISGLKYCACFANNASVGRYAGQVGKIENVFGPIECQKHCQDTEGCENFIWNGPEKKGKPNTCQLKKGPGGKDNSFGEARDIGRISGPKVCNGRFPKYIQGKQGEEACPKGYRPIKGNTECTKAADYYSYLRSDKVFEINDKSVCYYCAGCKKPAVYNSDKYGAQASWLCKRKRMSKKGKGKGKPKGRIDELDESVEEETEE